MLEGAALWSPVCAVLTAADIPADEFCPGPGENVLRPGEIIYRIIIPLEKNRFSGEKIKITMGAIGPKVLRGRRTEMLLRGEKKSLRRYLTAKHEP